MCAPTYIGSVVRILVVAVVLSAFAQAPDKTPSQTQLNGLSGVYTALGKAGTLTPSFNPVTGDLNFSFSTDNEGHLALGVATLEGVMQFSIVALGDKPRVLSSARIELNAEGSERHSQPATDAQLRELSERFNAAAGILETLIITVDVKGSVTCESVTAAGDKVTAVINR